VKGNSTRARSRKVSGTRIARSKVVRNVREDLAVELYSLVNLALRDFGVNRTERAKAIERASNLKAAPKVSGPILRDWWRLGSLLLEWSRDALYLDGEGKPRVLPIEGSGTTFEGLARRFLPDKPLREVVAMACEVSEVATRPGDRIALLGSIMVNIVGSPERSLAHTVRQVDQLVQTKLYNRRMHVKGSADGHMERMVIGKIARTEFADFMREIRPQIYDLLMRADSSFDRRRPDTFHASRNETAVSIGVYVAQENDLERAGVDAVAQVKRLRRKIQK
jgi:Family of unknown function (DUF6502)